MKVLIACEYSGRVRNAFAALGHDVLSADFEPAEDNSPYHYQGDCFDLINDQHFDLMIAHPPCTYLSVSGMHWTTRGLRDPQLTEKALEFVQKLMSAPIEKIVIENPVSVISSRIRKPDQIVQPWHFGEDASKKTCLWLKGVQPLQPVGQLEGDSKTRRSNQTASGQNKLAPSPTRWKERSRTYQGIADAMASQWGGGAVQKALDWHKRNDAAALKQQLKEQQCNPS